MPDVSENYQIFISHTSKDKDLAWELCVLLEKFGFSCWIAPRDIPAGCKYELAIMKGIEICPVMIVVCTDNIHSSDYMLDEINAAKRRKKLIISVFMQKDYSFNEEYEFLLSRYQWVDMSDGNIQDHIPEITNAAGARVSPSKRIRQHDFKITTEAGTVSSVQTVNSDGGMNNVDSIRKKAAMGDMWSQYILGRMYGGGYIVTGSYSEAVKLYKEASAQGHLMARSVLHSLVPSEKEVSDEDLGSWMERNSDRFISLAEEGNPIAQCDVGWMYQYGKGCRQSYKDALEWYRKSANQGYARAQNILGVMYRDGIGTDRSYKDAFDMFKSAANQNYARAQYHLALMYHYGQGVEASDTTAVEYLLAAANQGHPMAQNFLGYLYQHGLGVDRSDISAVTWYTESAERGFSYGQYNLGVMYLNGHGVDRSLSVAKRWFEKAAEQNHPDALYNLGVFYENGYECESSKSKAMELFKKAADLGSAEAKDAYSDISFEP
ncbi:MAG: TIR domain-containing protein [Candidatus Methanomethylophilaceae archaeon]